MSMHTISAVLGLLLVAGPAAGAEREVLIWGGSPQATEAAALKAELEKDPSRLPPGLGLTKGFPRLIESKTLKGLKPGFHIVILGFCAKDEAQERLEALKVKNKGAYTRTVTAPDADASACPALAAPPAVKAEDVLRVLKPMEKERGRVQVVRMSVQDSSTGRLAAHVQFQGRKGQQTESEGHALVALVSTLKGPKVLGSVDLDGDGKEVELQVGLERVAPRELAAAVILSFESQEEPSDDPGVEEGGSELTLYRLAEEGPSEVLSFELRHRKSDVECTTTREATYTFREEERDQGFYALAVERVTSDGGCALIYWDRSQGDPPDDLGTSREERLYRWDGSRYR